MAKTLLDGVNEVLKNTDVLDSDTGLLESLTDSARQVFIDTAVTVLNEVLDDLYSPEGWSKPKQLRESTITLADGEKEYALHSSLVLLRPEFNLIDEANNHIIKILDDDGYWQTVMIDLDQDDTGLPSFCAISPINGRLVFDRTPTSVEAGRDYKYRYDRDLVLETKDDCFPFNDAVFRALAPAATEWWRLRHQQEFSERIYKFFLARARRFLRRTPARTSYLPRQAGSNLMDPFNDNTVQG
jgi:hypothetical protein